MSWYDGELFPVKKDWENAPYDIAQCEHEKQVVAPIQAFDQLPAARGGSIALHCMNCDQTWWEPSCNIKGSPWEGK